MVRPLGLIYGTDEIAREVEDQLFIGENIMIAPVYVQNATGRIVYVPEKMKLVRFSKGEVKLVLYGSRDLENWRIIKTSKTHRITGIAGTPYKYFRILIIANMDGDSNTTSLSVDFMPRYNNKLR
jgi:hypothetical protein